MITALGGTLPMLHGTERGDPYQEGVIIWDVSDPVDPKMLSQWSTEAGGGGGVHRFFYSGGRYVHLSASCKGFRGFIYRILDIVDPRNPVEVGRWWMPDQWVAGFVEPKGPALEGDPQLHLLDSAVMHGPAYPKGDLAYVSYGGAGMVILDIQISLPKLIGQLRHHPPLAGKLSGARCHTVLPLSESPYAIMTTEGERFSYFNEEITGRSGAQPVNIIGMVDVQDRPTPPSFPCSPTRRSPRGGPTRISTRSPAWALDRSGRIHPRAALPPFVESGSPGSIAATSTPAYAMTTSATPSCLGRSPTSSRPTPKSGCSTTWLAIFSPARTWPPRKT